MSARFPSYGKDPNEVQSFHIKMHGNPELVIEVCREKELGHVLERPDTNCDFMVLHIRCTYGQKKAAQQEWCRRMTVGAGWTDKMLGKQPTEDLFA